MKIALVAINSKYIHSNLAVRYLADCIELTNWEPTILEFSINEDIMRIFYKLIAEKYDAYGFSCYIWNIEIILKLISILKKIVPSVLIVLGGPEVSYCAESLLTNHSSVDAVICGEGEEAIQKLLTTFEENAERSFHESLTGIAFRNHQNEIVFHEGQNIAKAFDQISFPYRCGFDGLHNKIIYYESSRGCPFHCDFCLSSLSGNVRFLPEDRVINEINQFVNAKVHQVKFVDRTFNADVSRCKRILNHILNLNSDINFHIEICADLLDEETITLINNMPVGRLQIEAGIQTINEKALNQIHRNNNLLKIKNNLQKISEKNNVHLHVDLIIGLPHDTQETVEETYNFAYSLNPNMLQIGFLKILRGSRLEKESEKYGIVYTGFPPYEVLQTNWLNAWQIANIKSIEAVNDAFLNSGRFKNALTFCIDKYICTPFSFMSEFSLWLKNQGYYEKQHSPIQNFMYISNYMKIHLTEEEFGFLGQILKYDYIISMKPKGLPDIFPKMNNDDCLYANCLYKDTALICDLFPDIKGNKNISKTVRLEKFSIDIMMYLKEKKIIKKDTWIAFRYFYGEKGLQIAKIEEG